MSCKLHHELMVSMFLSTPGKKENTWCKNTYRMVRVFPVSGLVSEPLHSSCH